MKAKLHACRKNGIVRQKRWNPSLHQPVYRKLPNIVEALQPLKPQYRKDGEYVRNKQNEVCRTYFTSDDIHARRQFSLPTVALSTPASVYNNIPELEKRVVDAIKGTFNNSPCLACWHDGHSDDSCTFRGLHLHILLHSHEPSFPCGHYQYMRLTTVIKETKTFLHGLTVHYQRCANMSGLTAYLLKDPRILIGINNEMMLNEAQKHLTLEVQKNLQPGDPTWENTQLSGQGTVQTMWKTNDELEEAPFADIWEDGERPNTSEQSLGLSPFGQQLLLYRTPQIEQETPTTSQQSLTFQQSMKDCTPQQRQKVPISATARKIEHILARLKECSATTYEEVLEHLKGQTPQPLEEIQRWRTIMTSMNSVRMLQQAQSEMEMDRKQTRSTYIDTLIESNFGDESDMMSTQETARTFIDWCQEQNITPAQFILDLYLILGMKLKKINTFMLHGRSNAGKTYWMNCLIPLPNIVGQTVPSADFAWMDCPNKQIIMVPELNLTKPEQVEEAKCVFEGATKKIGVKNKAPQYLYRTPLLLTCNTKPWANYTEEEEGLRNRMLMYEDLVESQVLPNAGNPNLRFFPHAFKYVKDELDTGPDFGYDMQSDPDKRSEVEEAIDVFLKKELHDYVSLEEFWEAEEDEFIRLCSELYSSVCR